MFFKKKKPVNYEYKVVRLDIYKSNYYTIDKILGLSVEIEMEKGFKPVGSPFVLKGDDLERMQIYQAMVKEVNNG